MVQVPRVTTVATAKAEATRDLFDELWEDGEFCEQDRRRMRHALDRVVFMSSRADLATAIGVNAIRGGAEGYRFHDLVKQWDELNAHELAAEPLDAA